MDTPKHPASGQDSSSASELALQSIREALVGLQFGQVTVTIQDGRVMQIERRERRRLSSDRNQDK